uniref:Late embryogenesis abundant protein LEA-2 subgroup domain-containing protein n=1 Tax=Kalanchoe fedtschenkoi TaxID=63787 RepID=A0A7N0RB38_KALFE
MGIKSAILTSKRRRKTICCSVAALILLTALLALILGLTVLKPRHPVTTVDSVSLDDYNLSFDLLTLRPLLNLTLNLHVSVSNPNKVDFKYSRGGSALLYYKGQLVGDAPIPPGRISAGGTETIHMKLTVFADRLISNSDLVMDLGAGEIVFRSVTKLSGKAQMMHIIQFSLTSETSCDLKVNLLSRSVENSGCKYKTKL